MSEMKRDVDLAGFERERPPAGVPAKKKRRLAILVPLLLLIGFAAVFASTLQDLWRGAVRVTVVRPQPAGSGAAAAGAIELQRSGWVEPDPFAIAAPALTPGIVREMLVLESATVENGQPIAQLVDDEAKLALEEADAAAARAEGETRRAAVERDLAQEAFEAALDVTAAESISTAELAGRTAASEQRAAAAREARSKVRIAEEELALQQFLAENGGAGPRQVELAQARLDAEQAALAGTEAEAALALAEVDKAKAQLVRATRERELRLTDRLRLESAQAQLTVAEAAARGVRVARDAAALRLARTTVRAPAAGIVLQRLAQAGSAVGGPNEPPVCTLYDPKSLRVRVDVEQSEVARVAVGRRARVRSPMRPDRLHAGEVTRVVHYADVQKVTLQVHVRLLEPDDSLRPEMLVEVRFLADDAPAPVDDVAGGATVAIPSRLLLERDGATRVWVVDPISGRATLRPVDVERRDGERALVRSGLNVSDKVIDEGRETLREGARVTVAATEER
jgi:RND family efflux transporter MFP subunit